MIKYLFTLISILFFLKSNAQEINKEVDKFKIGRNKVEVVFFDPFQNILIADPEFDSKSDKEKSEILDNYLHNSILYEFKLTQKKAGLYTKYQIVGDPEKPRSKMFYQVKAFENQVYIKTIETINCGGTLFEHMYLFDDPSRKKHVGNGVQLFGYFRRVQPYKEIKDSMVRIIEEDLKN
jgi:hypothetical protein